MNPHKPPERLTPLRVLYIEDAPPDAELGIVELQAAGYRVEWELVSSLSELQGHMHSHDFDVVLADYRLPGWTGLDACRAMQETGKDIPFILVSGTLGDEQAVECIKQGVWDYVLKDKMARLPLAVSRALRTRELQVERAAAERERERLVRDLVERERKYRELFELANEAILIFEPVHEIVLEANPCACAMYGCAHSELLGMSLKRLTRDIDRGEQQIASLMRAGSWNNFETMHYRIDGTPIHILANAKVIEYAGRPAILTVNRDVTELKNAEEALHRAHNELEKRVAERTAELARVNVELSRSRDEWQATFDCMSDPIMVLDPEYHILRGNRAFREMFPNADLETARCYELVHGLDHAPDTCPLARTVAERRTEVSEFFEPHLGRFIAVRTDPMFDEEGELSRIVHTVSDISERKEIDRMKNEFVGRVSHELRTPLSSVRGFAELMLQREYPAEKRRRFLELIQRESERLGRLINDVLDIQRIESGQQVLRYGAVSLPSVAAETAETLSSADSHHGILLEMEAGLPPVRADVDSLRQVLTNLVSNALKYSPDGGEVRIAARQQAGEVLVSVQDHGVGIPVEALPRVFSKFYRVENQATRQIGGTGLGLALVKDIVEMHGGRVWAESEVRKGSTFYFTLPLWEASDAAAA